jgi:hypothetical protein
MRIVRLEEFARPNLKEAIPVSNPSEFGIGLSD